MSRVAGLFSRRGYNIESLSVGETDKPEISRMTIRIICDDCVLEQIKKQLNKLINIIKVTELKEDRSVYRELILVKVRSNDKNRASIIEATNLFRGKIIDVAPRSFIIELTGTEDKVLAFIDIVSQYGILDLVRTGFTGLERGHI